MLEADPVCKQCGWDRSQDGAPSQDPADQKARIGVAAGLAVAYVVMFKLIAGSTASALPMRVAIPIDASAAAQPAYSPVTGEAVALGAAPSSGATVASATTKPGALFTIKVADTKSATIAAHDALQYVFTLPETEENCQLLGQVHGIGGFSPLEIFLLTDDEYVFWNANPAAIPHSSWETMRGSEATLDYRLAAGGTYHLVISNVMSPSPRSVQAKAQVKCAKS